jgi:uncharacterized protein YndB with AHSA1/START domain
MKIALFVVAGIVALIGLMAVIGSLLPRQHVASRAGRFRQPPDTLWATLTDFAALPTWAPEMKKVHRLEDRNGHPVWMHEGSSWSAPMEVVEFTPPRRFALRIADEKLPFGGTWIYDIAPVDGGSVVTITEDGEIRNPLFRFLARFVFGYTSTMDGYLKALGKKHGETVAPQAAAAVR